MSISALGSVSGIGMMNQVVALDQKMGAPLSTPATSTDGTTSITASDTDSVSGIGKLLSVLQDLATADPTQFKQATSDIATQLSDAASNTTGDESSFLKGLANQFQQASDTGDAAALTPKHHVQHSQASSGSSSSSTASQYDEQGLFALLNSSSTSANSYLSSSQQTLLDSLFGSSNS
jgi:hypothetical protein